MQLLKRDAAGYVAEVKLVTIAEDIDRVDLDNNKTRVLLNFGQHGRELITTEVALRLLRILSGEYSANDDQVANILSRTVFKIVPMENANGRKIVEDGKLCERRNGRGVDTNRNWDIDWGRKEKDYDPAEEYPGSEPFSEPEAEILRGIAQTFKPHLWVNVHSGMQALLMPYDHKKSAPGDGAAEQMNLLLRRLNKLHCNDRCEVGSGGVSVGYLAHGTATDYMYDILKVPIAFTFEIYGDVHADADDCFRMFNPTTPDSFEDVVSRWSLAFITLAGDLSEALTRLPNRATIDWKWKNRKVGMLWDFGDGFIAGETSSSSLQLPLLATGLLLCYLAFLSVKRLYLLKGRFR